MKEINGLTVALAGNMIQFISLVACNYDNPLPYNQLTPYLIGSKKVSYHKGHAPQHLVSKISFNHT